MLRLWCQDNTVTQQVLKFIRDRMTMAAIITKVTITIIPNLGVSEIGEVNALQQTEP